MLARSGISRDFLLRTLLALICFLLVRSSPVRRCYYYASSDPYGCLLVSQSLIHNHTIKLDSYGSVDTLTAKYYYRVFTRNNHSYYYFPLGTSLFTTPFVWFADLLSMDMALPGNDWALQGWLAALTVSATAALVYELSRSRLGSFQSMLFTVFFVLGSSIISTCGTALWSFNFELIFILVGLHAFLAISNQHAKSKMLSILLGISLFMAYLCRPSALVFALGCVGYLVIRNRPMAYRVALALFFCLLAFAGFSLHEYAGILPPYYQFSCLNGSTTFWRALLGNLASPSRGLLVFSPFFLPILTFGILRLRKNFLLLSLAYGWLILDLVAVSRFPHWWGGHSYGPRLLTDAVPAILLIGILTAPRQQGIQRTVFWSLVLLLGTLSVGIHSGQGLFNKATIEWNRHPDVDNNPEYVFDWRCPQFAVTPSLLEKRMARRRKGKI